MTEPVSSSVNSTCFSAFATSVSLFFPWLNERTRSVNSATVIFFADHAGDTHANTTARQIRKRFMIPLLKRNWRPVPGPQGQVFVAGVEVWSAAADETWDLLALLRQLEILVFRGQHGAPRGVFPRRP